MAKRKGNTPRAPRPTAREVIDDTSPKYLCRIVSFKELKKNVAKESERHYHRKGSNVYTTVKYTGNKRIISRYVYVNERKKINPTFDKFEKKFRKSDSDDFGGSTQTIYGRVTDRWRGKLAPDGVALKSAGHRSIKRNTSRLNSTALRVQMEHELRSIEQRGADYTVRELRESLAVQAAENKKKKEQAAARAKSQAQIRPKAGKRTTRGR